MLKVDMMAVPHMVRTGFPGGHLPVGPFSFRTNEDACLTCFPAQCECRCCYMMASDVVPIDEIIVVGGLAIRRRVQFDERELATAAFFDGSNPSEPYICTVNALLVLHALTPLAVVVADPPIETILEVMSQFVTDIPEA